MGCARPGLTDDQRVGLPKPGLRGIGGGMTKPQQLMLDRLIAPWLLTLTCWGASLRTAEALERHGYLEDTAVDDHYKYKAGRVRAFKITIAGREAAGWRS